MKGLFQRCLELGQPLEIIYISNSNKITQRTIVINEITPQYLKAYCLLRKQNRLFKINNILSALPSKNFTKIS